MSFTAPFGHWLKQQRHLHDITQEELGQQLGYSAITIRKVEAGKLRPSRYLIDKVAHMYAVPAKQQSDFLAFARGADWHAPIKRLPTPANPILGRERESAELMELLRNPEVRLLTLVGPPGVGKTRLAIHLGTQLADEFADGLCFVDLSSAHNAIEMLHEIAQALGLRALAGPDALEYLQGFLEARQLLLILDNFEQLLSDDADAPAAAAAPAIADLLAAAPQLRVLLTSRASVNLSGAHEYSLAPLALPSLNEVCGDGHDGGHDGGHHGGRDGGTPVSTWLSSPAVALFVQRARALRPGFELTPHNVRAVVEICRCLDGLPLALELAAVRIRMFSPQRLLDRLNHHFDEPFSNLPNSPVHGPLDLPRRQHTLHATLDWSYQLLTPDERRLLNRLSIFNNGCSLLAAQAVCGDQPLALADWDFDAILNEALVEHLHALIQHHLLQRDENPAGETRLSLLGFVRDYAAEQLRQSGELEMLQRRHTDYYARFAEPTHVFHYAQHAWRWHQRLVLEMGNLRAALENNVALQGCVKTRLQLACTYAWIWCDSTIYQLADLHSDHTTAWLEQLLQNTAGMPPTLQARAEYGLGQLCILRHNASGRSSSAERDNTTAIAAWVHFNAALQQYQAQHDVLGEAAMLVSCAGLAYVGRQYDLALALCRQAVPAWDALSQPGGQAFAHHLLGAVLLEHGQFAEAEREVQTALDLRQRPGFEWAIDGGIGGCQNSLGALALLQGRYEQAIQHCQAALQRHRANHDPVGSVISLALLGHLALLQGNLPRALLDLSGALRSSATLSHEGDTFVILALLAQTYVCFGDDEIAMQLAGAAAQGEPEVDPAHPSLARLTAVYAGILCEAQTRLAQHPELSAAWQRGAAQPLAQTVTQILALSELSELPEVLNR